MPRRARIRFAGIPQHVIQRGNNRAACFFAEEDYRSYLDSPQQGAARHALDPTCQNYYAIDRDMESVVNLT